MPSVIRVAKKKNRPNKDSSAKFSDVGLGIGPARKAWKPVDLPGDLIANDDAFAYLCGFEEIIPEPAPVGLQKTKKAKKKVSRKRKTVQNLRKPNENGRPGKDEDLLTNDDGNDADQDRSQDGANDDTAQQNEPDRKKNKRNTGATKRKRKDDGGDDEAGTSLSGGADNNIRLVQWDGLFVPDPVLLALGECGFVEPTPIQRLVLPAAIRDRLDILGAAETGSGKTLAFGIPIVARLLEMESNGSNGDGTEKGIRALVLAPTRELALQVKTHISAILRHTELKVTSIVGGLSQQKQERLLKSRPEIVVATPGRLWALMQEGEGVAPYLSNLSQLRCLIIDETDRMIEKGHYDELSYILERVNSQALLGLQTMVFSATLTYAHPPPKRLTSAHLKHETAEDKIARLIEIANLRKERKTIDITREFGTAESLVETRLNCKNLLDKDSNLYYLLKRYPGRTLIFTNSIDAARRLYGLLTKLNLDPPPAVLHAKMHQKQRLKNVEKFADHPNSILLATDVAARGLDIKGIEHVIHYQVPKTAEIYVHRSGRTGRASSKGLTVLLVDPQDVQFYRRICRNLNRDTDLPLFPVDSHSLAEVAKARVQLATEIESIDYKIRKSSSRENWFVKSAREADLELDESLQRSVSIADESVELKRKRKSLCGQLRSLLSVRVKRATVDTPKTKYPTYEMVVSSARSSESTKALDALERDKQSDAKVKRAKQLLSGRMVHKLGKEKKRKRKKMKR